MREAGCTAAQEMAFGVANAIAYVDAVVERGVPIDDFAPRLSWIFNTHMNFFEEIAKYRALRRLWATTVRDRWGATDPRSMMLRTHTQTAGSTLTLQQPENNIVRAAIQALAAALGGVQSMALSCFDEAIAIPTTHAQTLALRTQQMLQHEFGITDVADPLGGSWYVEQLTDRLEAEARALMAEIERMGGAVNAIEQGFYQQLIADEAYARSSGSPRARTWWSASTRSSTRRRRRPSGSTSRRSWSGSRGRSWKPCAAGETARGCRGEAGRAGRGGPRHGRSDAPTARGGAGRCDGR